MDGLPASGVQDIRNLQTAVAQAQKSAATGRALTTASKGWRLGGDAPEPDELGDGEVHIRSDGGSLVVRSQSGDIVVGDIPFGPSVSDPSVSLFNPPPEYSQAQIQTYTDGMQSINDQLVALLAVLRSGRFPS